MIANRRVNAAAAKLCCEHVAEACALELRQVGRVLDHAVADVTGDSHADASKCALRAGGGENLIAHGFDDAVGGHLDQRVLVVFAVAGRGKHVERADERVIDYKSGPHPLRQHHADNLCHSALLLAYSNLRQRFRPLNAAAL